MDQMKQAARSTKQNIAEGLTDGQTSFEVEIKLLGIAKGSNQELLEDYQDYLKHHEEKEWAETNIERYNKLRTFCKANSKDEAYHPFYAVWTDIEMANCAICLCHMIDKAMTTFIAQRDKEFVSEGGIRERMTAARLDMRGTQKQIIEQQEQRLQEQEQIIAQLQEQVRSLQRELEVIKTK